MNLPEMIIFDYGQTLVYEKPYDVLSGITSVLEHAIVNPDNVEAEELTAFANEIFAETVRYKSLSTIEIHNLNFQNYVYEYFGLEFDKSPLEIERLFENASSSADPTNNIELLLQLLHEKGIRTSVISNMSFSGPMLKERINNYIPNHNFEFILASSEYVYRKPDRRIFELALKKARLQPQQVWYCGDNVICDVDGSANCGIYPVWYKGSPGMINEGQPNNPCLEINDWSELIEILSKD